MTTQEAANIGLRLEKAIEPLVGESTQLERLELVTVIWRELQAMGYALVKVKQS